MFRAQPWVGRDAWVIWNKNCIDITIIATSVETTYRQPPVDLLLNLTGINNKNYIRTMNYQIGSVEASNRPSSNHAKTTTTPWKRRLHFQIKRQQLIGMNLPRQRCAVHCSRKNGALDWRLQLWQKHGGRLASIIKPKPEIDESEKKLDPTTAQQSPFYKQRGRGCARRLVMMTDWRLSLPGSKIKGIHAQLSFLHSLTTSAN